MIIAKFFQVDSFLLTSLEVLIFAKKIDIHKQALYFQFPFAYNMVLFDLLYNIFSAEAHNPRILKRGYSETKICML